MVTHLLGWPGQDSAASRVSSAPLFFLSFLTRASTAFSAHFSSSSPCFQPSSFLTAGEVKENRELRLVMAAGSGHWRGQEGITICKCLQVSQDNSASKKSIRRFVITEKAPTRAFSWLEAATTAFTFKTLLRHFAKRAFTPRSLNVNLGLRRNYHKSL